MLTDVLRMRATGVSDRPRRAVVMSILIALATIASAVILPNHGTSAPVFTQNGWSTSVTPDAATVQLGARLSFELTVSSSTARTGLVDLDITDPAGRKVFQRAWKP